MGRVIAVFNQKGGVGKTTTAVNLAASLAEKGKRILLIDNDPQGNLTSGLGVRKDSQFRSIYEVVLQISPIQNTIIPTDFENLHLVPGSIHLAGAEIEITSMKEREFLLKRQVDVIRHLYDYIIIDCPPSLGLLSINALSAADSILIPIQCEFFALEGVSQLVHTYTLVKENINRSLEVEGVLISMFDGRNNLSIQVVDEVKKYFAGTVYRTIIPRNVRLAEAPSFGLPIIHYDRRSKGAEAFLELAEEFIELREEYDN
ncbi:MAG: AAA family ATPase [Bacillota bacterium]|nr:AAA family ATPase [Bacillota bacterium]